MYYVLFLDDLGDLKVKNHHFATRAEADRYARTIHPNRNPRVTKTVTEIADLRPSGYSGAA